MSAEGLDARGPVCELCEKAPAEPDDCFCHLCRIEVTAMSEIVHDPVLIALSHHQHVCFLSNMDRTMCRCGVRFEGGPAYHREHLAAVIYEALGLPGPIPNTPASDEIGGNHG